MKNYINGAITDIDDYMETEFEALNRNLTNKELTYGEIFEHFLENCKTKLPIEDYRPCLSMYGVPNIPYAIVIWLVDGTKIIYIDK